jgi:hypothetical protein
MGIGTLEDPLVDAAGLPSWDDVFEEASEQPAGWQQLVGERPGVAGLHALATTDLAASSIVEQLDALAMLEAHRSWLDGLQQRLLADIARQDTSTERWSAELVSVVLGLAPQTATTKIRNAERLCRDLPLTHRALIEGRISVLQAVAITEASYPLADGTLAHYEQRVLQRAEQQTLRQLKDSVRRAVIALEPDAAEHRRTRALQDRHVRVEDAGDGMAWLTALLPAPAAMACYRRLEAAARTAAHGDDRTADQRRADLLIDALHAGLAGSPPASHRADPTIAVTVGLETLARIDDEPGWLAGYGPITAEHARELAADPTATWRRIVLDPLFGSVIDYGTTRYRPPKSLSEHVTTRHGHCAFPTCRRAAEASDLDHSEPFPAGPTAASNLAPLCRRHHRLKHHTGWTYHHNADATTTWISPHGHAYTNHPPQRWTHPEPPPSVRRSG